MQFFRNEILEILYECAFSYSRFLNKKIKVKIGIDKFSIRFCKSNFLHLTGVRTNLECEKFFDLALKKDLLLTNILNLNDKNERSKIKHKIKNLKFINTYFNHTLYVQRNYKKGNIHCYIASTNLIYTLGFVKVKNVLIPMTLLNGNKLDKSKKITSLNVIVK